MSEQAENSEKRKDGIKSLSSINVSTVASFMATERTLKEGRIREMVHKVPMGHPILGRLRTFEEKGINLIELPETHPVMLELTSLIAQMEKAESGEEHEQDDTSSKPEGKRTPRRSRSVGSIQQQARLERERLEAMRKAAKGEVVAALDRIAASVAGAHSSLETCRAAYSDSPSSLMYIARLEKVLAAIAGNSSTHKHLISRLED